MITILVVLSYDCLWDLEDDNKKFNHWFLFCFNPEVLSNAIIAYRFLFIDSIGILSKSLTESLKLDYRQLIIILQLYVYKLRGRVDASAITGVSS